MSSYLSRCALCFAAATGMMMPLCCPGRAPLLENIPRIMPVSASIGSGIVELHRCSKCSTVPGLPEPSLEAGPCILCSGVYDCRVQLVVMIGETWEEMSRLSCLLIPPHTLRTSTELWLTLIVGRTLARDDNSFDSSVFDSTDTCLIAHTRTLPPLPPPPVPEGREQVHFGNMPRRARGISWETTQ